jgi:hypothetical protein
MTTQPGTALTTTTPVPAIADVPGQQFRQPQPIPTRAVTVAPLSQPSVAAFLAEHRRYDPEGVATLERKWPGSEMAANLGHSRDWLSRHLTPERQQQVRAAGFDLIPLYELTAQWGREDAYSGTPPATTKGNSMTDAEAREADEKQFREVTRKIHDARARNDHITVRELDKERTLIAERLFPGSTEPDANHRRTI